MTLIYLMDIWQKTFPPLNRFFDHSNVSVRSPPPPSLLPPQNLPSGQAGTFYYFFVFGADLTLKTAADHLSEQITRKKQMLPQVREFLLLFFFFFLSHQETRRQLFVSKRKKIFQNGAGAKCCGGEEGACEEMCAYEVSAGRNIETAEPVIIISHPLTSLPNV